MSWESNHPSHGGLSLSFDIFKKKDKLDEQTLYDKYLQSGYPEDAAAYLAKKSMESGHVETELPTFRNLLHPSDTPSRPVSLPPAPDIPERSTLKDFNPMRQDALTFIDKADPTNPKFAPIPRGIRSKGTVSVDSTEGDGENIYVDAANGEEIRRENNGTKSSKVIKIGSAGGGKDSVDVELKKRAIQKIQDLQAKGLPVPQELVDMAQSGESDIGVSVNQPVEQPGAIRKFFGAKPTLGQPVVSFNKGGGGSFQSPDEVKAAYKAGKLSRNKAISILRSQFGHQ